MKRIIVTLNIVLMALYASAQLPYQSVVNAIESFSPLFEVLENQKEAGQLSAMSESLFQDPEVEFGYYGGSPSEVGNRWDLSVMQPVELPKAIKTRNRIRHLLSEEAEVDFRICRAELLKEVMTTCNDIVYYRQCVDFYTRCVSRAQQLSDVYKKRMEAGDCSILEYNRVMMDLADLQNKLNLAKVDADMSMDNLRILNGGKPIEFDQSHFDEVVLPSNIDSFVEDCLNNGYLNAKYSMQFQQANARLDLAIAECMPKFQVGYKSENTVGETFRGVAVGVTLPIWSRKNTVKHANSEIRATMNESTARMDELSNRIKSIYFKANSLQQTLQTLRDIYNQYDVEELLLKAFNAGELSLESYLQQVEFYHDSRMTIIEIERELNDLNVELQSAKL